MSETKTIVDLRAVQELNAIIETDPGPIALKALGEFFTLFRGAYAATLDSMVASGDFGGAEPLESWEGVVVHTIDRSTTCRI